MLHCRKHPVGFWAVIACYALMNSRLAWHRGPDGGEPAGVVTSRSAAAGRARAERPRDRALRSRLTLAVMAARDTAKPPALRAVRTGAGLGRRPGAAPSAAGTARGPAAKPAPGDGGRAGPAAGRTA